MLNDESGGPIKGQGLQTEQVVAGIVIGCLIALILIRRGFRGINVPGVGGVGVR